MKTHALSTKNYRHYQLQREMLRSILNILCFLAACFSIGAGIVVTWFFISLLLV